MGIVQARILEWVAMPSSKGSSQARDQTQVSHIAGRFFTSWVMREAQKSPRNCEKKPLQSVWTSSICKDWRMVSQDSQSQDTLERVDTASDGGPFLSAPHYSFTQHPLLPLFISLQDELKGQKNWNCEAIRKNIFFWWRHSYHSKWEFSFPAHRLRICRGPNESFSFQSL